MDLDLDRIQDIKLQSFIPEMNNDTVASVSERDHNAMRAYQNIHVIYVYISVSV